MDSVFNATSTIRTSNFELRSVTTLGRKAWTWPRRSMAQLWCQLPTAAAESETTSQRILGAPAGQASPTSQSTHRFLYGFSSHHPPVEDLQSWKIPKDRNQQKTNKDSASD